MAPAKSGSTTTRTSGAAAQGVSSFRGLPKSPTVGSAGDSIVSCWGDGSDGGGEVDGGAFDVRQVASGSGGSGGGGSDGGGRRSSSASQPASNGKSSVGIGGVIGSFTNQDKEDEEEQEEELEVTQPDDVGFDNSWEVGEWVGGGAAGDSGGFGATAESAAGGVAALASAELDSAGLKRDRNGRRTTSRSDGVHSASKRSHGRTMMVEAMQNASRGGAPNLT